MKPKAILTLIVVFVVLAALVLMKRSQETTVSITEQVDLIPLVSADIDVSSVNRLEIYGGTKPSERVVLVKDGERWTINSLYGAPAVEGRPQQMLDTIEGLEGEFRATVSGDAMADYDLTDDRAFHVIGFKGEREEMFHVLAGKAPSYGNLFMRANGSDDVYLVNKNIRRDAYIYSLDHDDVPQSTSWLNKQIISIDGDDFTKVELTMPDKKIVAEKRDIPKEDDAESGDDTVEITDAEQEWVITEGGFSGDVHQTPFRDLEKYVANLTAFEAVNPEKKEIWGLDDPKYHLVMHRENGEKIELDVGHPSFIGPAYVQRLDGDDQTLYAIEKNKFDALFASGGAFHDLPGLLMEENALTDMSYTTPDAEVTLAKTGSAWSVVSPKSDLPVNSETLSELERVLSSWQAADYADAGTDAGFADSQYSAAFSTADKKHRIVLGSNELDAKSARTEGRYAKLDDRSDILVMSKADYDGIFLALKDLFDSSLVTVADDDEIVNVAIKKGDGSASLELSDLDWSVSVNGAEVNADETAIDSLLSAIESAEATDVALDTSSTSGEPVGSLTVQSDKGVTWELTLASAEDDQYLVSVNGSTSRYVIDQSQFDKLLPDLNSFTPAVNNTDASSASDVEETVEFKPPELNAPAAHDEHEGHNH